MPIEAMIEQLRKSIKVAPLNPMPGTSSHGLPGFTVDVTLGEAKLAQQICTEITSMFMNQNIHQRQKRSEEHTSELQSHSDLVCRLLLEKKKKKKKQKNNKHKMKHKINI